MVRHEMRYKTFLCCKQFKNIDKCSGMKHRQTSFFPFITIVKQFRKQTQLLCSYIYDAKRVPFCIPIGILIFQAGNRF